MTLLAQIGDSLKAGACAAWVHGRAAEIANAGRPIRGVTMATWSIRWRHAWRLVASVTGSAGPR